MEYSVQSENVDLYEDDPGKNSERKVSNIREPLETLDLLTTAVIKYIRKRQNFWLKKSIIPD